MKSALRTTAIFVIGLLLGSVATDFAWQHVGRQMQEIARVGTAFEAERQAERAYFQQPAAVGEWELARAIALLQVQPALAATPAAEQQRAFGLFVAHARLARLQQSQSKAAEAKRSLVAARALLPKAVPGFPAESDDASVFALLARWDQATISRGSAVP